jgi:hypothetical protein
LEISVPFLRENRPGLRTYRFWVNFGHRTGATPQHVEAILAEIFCANGRRHRTLAGARHTRNHAVGLAYASREIFDLFAVESGEGGKGEDTQQRQMCWTGLAQPWKFPGQRAQARLMRREEQADWTRRRGSGDRAHASSAHGLFPFPKAASARQPLGSHGMFRCSLPAGEMRAQPLWTGHRDRRPSALRADACPPTLPIKVPIAHPANATNGISPGWPVITVQFHGRD